MDEEMIVMKPRCVMDRILIALKDCNLMTQHHEEGGELLSVTF